MNGKTKNNNMKKFEYRCTTKGTIDELNELGNDGWEVACAIYCDKFLLKREKKSNEKSEEKSEEKKAITLSEVYQREESAMTVRLKQALIAYAEDHGGEIPFYLVRINRYRNIGQKTQNELTELQRKYYNA